MVLHENALSPCGRQRLPPSQVSDERYEDSRVGVEDTKAGGPASMPKRTA